MGGVSCSVGAAWSGALVDWGDCTRFIDGFEEWAQKSERNDLDTKNDSVKSQGSLKRGRRRRARV